MTGDFPCQCPVCRESEEREASAASKAAEDRERLALNAQARQIARERIVGAAVAFIEHGNRERRQELAEAVEALRRLEDAAGGEAMDTSKEPA